MPKNIPRIFRPTPANLTRLANVLKRGGIVGVPSETVYGLAANAFSESACLVIFKAKRRPVTDPLIVHLASARDLDMVAYINETAQTLAERCWPGPLTLILPKKNCVPDIVTAGKSTVAVRVPAHPLFRRLIRLAGVPLAAPSANPFGYISPTTAFHVRDGLANTELRAVLDGGDCRVGVESTILDISTPGRARLLRPGGLALELIEEILKQKVVRTIKPAGLDANIAAIAPGMLTQHYSPSTPLQLHRQFTAKLLSRIPMDEAVLFLRRPHKASSRAPNIYWLSQNGDLGEIARSLFTLLRILDTESWFRIHAEIPDGEEGLAPAVRDRLTRAAAKY